MTKQQVETHFVRLAAEWKRETRLSSSITEKLLHPAYLKIISLGELAVNSILREMLSEYGHWHTALTAITWENPTEPNMDSQEVREAWLKWGVENHHLQDWQIK
jgi:hypothetical protein